MTNPIPRLPRSGVDFLLTAAGFGAALAAYDAVMRGGLSSEERLLGTGVSVVAFWCAIQLKGSGDDPHVSALVVFLEQLSFGSGVNLLLHSALTYLFQFRRTPFLIFVGGILAAGLIALHRKLAFDEDSRQSRTILVGFNAVSAAVAGSLRGLVGVVSDPPVELPPGLRLLGGLADLPALVATHRPTRLVIGVEEWESRLSPSFLLACRLNGVVVEDVPSIYERAFSKVCCGRLQPMDLLLSSSLRGDSRTMAIQAVYTNLAGLFFLLLLSPVMAIAALSVGLFGGPGPVIESVECAGFQYIPFPLLRFRTQSGGDRTMAGRVLRYLRLVNLPQLINVVRGDMALVGPQPVRREFARYLTDAMPFYSHRFSVKPGIVGWANLHTSRGSVPNETERIEYDLYYVKEGSVWLDAEILIEAALTRSSVAAGSHAALAGSEPEVTEGVS